MISRTRVIRWLREMEAERQIEALRRRNSDSSTAGAGGYHEKVPADHPDYKAKVAEPTMAAVDSLPVEWRVEGVAPHGYVDVYRAYQRRWSLARVKEQAARRGGLFVL